MKSLQTLFEDDNILLTPGGLETTLHFKTAFPLKEMAAFEILFSPKWREYVQNIQSSFIDVASKHGRPMLLDTETWRASSTWFDKLGTSRENRDLVSKLAMDFARELATRMKVKSNGKLTAIIQGAIGPQYDGYTYDDKTTFEDASEYHRGQIATLKEAGVDLITPMTMTNSTEAKAIASESNKLGIPCAISFTLGTDGLLPSGETLKKAIYTIDTEVHPVPLLYMVNCTHPKHIKPVLTEALSKKEDWIRRLRGVRANASAKSHDELDNSEELDEGNPEEWAQQMLELRHLLPNLNILGGCCGTDIRHCEELGELVHFASRLN